jgi:ATP-dependent DNA helicase RecQ
MLSSAQDGREKREVYAQLEGGGVKLLFVAPERLVQPGFLAELGGFGLASLVVDEAHCISHWGHDFRPEYRRVGELRERRPDVPIAAFTATATPQVRRDIAAQLGLRDPLELIGDFDRPNLTYRFLPRGDSVAQALAVIRRHDGEAGIGYCLRRSDVDALAASLARAGVRCLPYHAGLDAATRKRNQERFLAEEIDVIVATVAFGMGIDRPDVRYVVHASLPKGVEQFAQETGRAGRDGLPSECVMLYSGADFHGWRSLAERSAAEAAAAGAAVDPEESARALARLSEMYGFATRASCRHRFLVEHFGQAFPRDRDAGCGACDVCLGEIERVEDPLVLAQKIGSCVARVKQRFGLVHVAAVLEGKSTPQIAQNGHDALSTFGLLKDLSAAEIKGYIEQLVARGFLQRTPGDYPVLELTATGVAMLKGQVAADDIVLCRQPKASTRSRTRGGRGDAAMGRVERESWEGVDRDLFDALRALRLEIARGRGVPPYVVFHDSTLREMAKARPRSLSALLHVPGVGARKAEDFGQQFLDAIASHGGG